MRYFNEDKTIEYTEEEIEKMLYDGKLVKDYLETYYPEQEEVEEVCHYVVLQYYEETGGRDVEKVIDVPYQPYVPEHTDTEEIRLYIPYTEEEQIERKKDKLRELREIDCFSYINRGKLWYDQWSEEQLKELDEWYKAWLDVTETFVCPNKPNFIDQKRLNDDNI